MTKSGRSNQYEGELSVTFAKLIGRHRLNAVLGGNLNSNKTLTQGYSAQGFPEGDFVYPSFLTSSLRTPKFFVKEFSYFLMPCHQHGLRINLLVQR